MAPPNRPPPRELQVLAKNVITPNLLRITLGGPGMDGFPPDQEGGYVKLRLQDEDGKLAVRTYTIRHQREGEIDLDFALHAVTATGSAGPATEWAMTVEPGATIALSGPGPAKPLPEGRDFYLIGGDMTALPAIAVNLQNLAPGARGLTVIEVMSEEDRQELARPEGMDVRWAVVPQPGSRPETLVAELRNAGKPDGGYAWCACEFSAMQQLRAYLRDECALGPDRLYISSYWKSGLTEDLHKIAKREDAEAQ